MTGYTQQCLLALSSGCLVKFIHGGAARLRAPTEATKQRCLARMAAWARLAHEVVEAECPHHSVFTAFSCFDLASGNQATSATGELADLQIANLKRLAQIFSVDYRQLRDELSKHRHLAAKIRANRICTNREAWLEAVRSTQKMHDASRWPAAALKACILRYSCWTSSTSKVEQQFSKADRTRSCGMTPASEKFEATCLRALSLQPTDIATVAQKAHSLYALCGSIPRTRAVERVDAGLKRKAKDARVFNLILSIASLFIYCYCARAHP